MDTGKEAETMDKGKEAETMDKGKEAETMDKGKEASDYEGITPSMQSSLRTSKRKALKPGRKKGSGKKNKGDNAKNKTKRTYKKRKSKLNILKAASPPKAKGKKTQIETETHEGEAEPAGPASKVRKNKGGSTEAAAAAKAKARKPRLAKGPRQGRVGSGKHWCYLVVEGQQYGCKSCRYIYNGCHHCRKDKFRGKNAQQKFAEQQASKEAEDTGSAGSAAEPSRIKKRKASCKPKRKTRAE